MYQSWGKLLLLHWPLPAESLRPLIPDPLVVDTFDGAAWVGITPFTMWGVRPVFFPPLPLLSESHELNVRTYVQLDGIPGIWFFSLDANNPIAALGARLAFHLPYFNARIDLEQQGRTIHFASRRTRPVLRPPGLKPPGRSVTGCRSPSRVRWSFSSPSVTVFIRLAQTPSTGLVSSIDPGPCTRHVCCRVARRCSSRKGCLRQRGIRCCTSKASL